METKIYLNKADLAKAFSEYLIKKIEASERLNIAISGGSTPKVIFDYLASEYPNAKYWSKVNFFWVDERCVDPDDDQSNYRMTKEHLFDCIDIPEQNIHRLKGEDIPDKEAIRYSKLLDVKLERSNGVPSFEMVILGMGDDGHTASIFPHQIDLFHSRKNCVVAEHPESGQNRISITGKIINNAKEVVVLVTGINKREKVKTIFSKGRGFADLPISLVQPKSKKYIWFMDSEAAAESVIELG